jgi:hypothetical protein
MSVLESELFHSTQSLVEVLRVPYSAIIRNWWDSLGIESFRLHWVPRDMTPGLRR